MQAAACGRSHCRLFFFVQSPEATLRPEPDIVSGSGDHLRFQKPFSTDTHTAPPLSPCCRSFE